MKNLQTTDAELLPEWLLPSDVPLSLAKAPRFPKNKDEMELKEMIYNAVFEYALDYVAAGTPLTSILRDDPRNIDYARFLRWVKKNPKRQARYDEAQQIAAEILVDKMDHLLMPENDGNQTIEEGAAKAEFGQIDNRRFMFEVLKWKAGAFNKKKFGSNKHIEVSSPDMSEDALKGMTTDDIKKMVAEQLVIDGGSL